MVFLKRVFWWSVFLGIFYLLCGYHYIIIGKNVKMLKKGELTLVNTFVNSNGKRPELLFQEPDLWKDGIGELLVETGEVTKEKLEAYKDKLIQEEYNRKHGY